MLTVSQLRKLASQRQVIGDGWLKTERIPCWEAGLVSKDGANLTQLGQQKVTRYLERLDETTKGIPLDQCRLHWEDLMLSEEWSRGKIKGKRVWASARAVFWTKPPERIRQWIKSDNEGRIPRLAKDLSATLNATAIRLIPNCYQQASPMHPGMICLRPMISSSSRIVRIYAYHYDYLMSIDKELTFWMCGYKAHNQELTPVIVRGDTRRNNQLVLFGVLNQAHAPNWPDPVIAPIRR